jgi:PilZ domain
MGKRTEPRAPRALQVRILGMGANGRPIIARAQTLNISRQGVVLEGVTSPVKSGEVVSLQYKDRKVRYRVIWAGEEGTSQASQLGLEKVNPKDDLWQDDLPPQEDGPDTHAHARRGERRHQRRFEAAFPVEVRSADGTPLRAQITDISLGGCYVNTLSPVTLDSIVTIVFWVGDQKLVVRGKVRTSIVGVGCGIEFVDMAPASKHMLEDFLQMRCPPVTDRRGSGAKEVPEDEQELISGASLLSRIIR